MEDEKVQLMNRLQRLQTKVETIPDFQPLLQKAHAFRMEQETQIHLMQKEAENALNVQQLETRLQDLQRRLSEQKVTLENGLQWKLNSFLDRKCRNDTSSHATKNKRRSEDESILCRCQVTTNPERKASTVATVQGPRTTTYDSCRTNSGRATYP